MPYKAPQELRPGIVLAEDVYNLDAKLLFSAGSKLSEKQIEILMMWGTEKVAVEGGDRSEKKISIGSFSNNIKNEAEIAVQKRLKLVKSSHPAVLAMREIAILEFAKSSNPKKSEC